MVASPNLQTMNETLRLSTTNTKSLSKMFAQCFLSIKEDKYKTVAYFLGNVKQKFTCVEDAEDGSVVLLSYANFRALKDEEDEGL